MSGGSCGLQDQAAAVFGGAHRWEWRYSDTETPFRRVPLLEDRVRQLVDGLDREITKYARIP